MVSQAGLTVTNIMSLPLKKSYRAEAVGLSPFNHTEKNSIFVIM